MAFFWRNNQVRRSDKVRGIPTSVNVGTLMFGLILVYIIITLFLYLTQKHVASYEVVEGTISGNYRYSAIALKEEEVEMICRTLKNQ